MQTSMFKFRCNYVFIYTVGYFILCFLKVDVCMGSTQCMMYVLVVALNRTTGWYVFWGGGVYMARARAEDAATIDQQRAIVARGYNSVTGACS